MLYGGYPQPTTECRPRTETNLISLYELIIDIDDNTIKIIISIGIGFEWQSNRCTSIDRFIHRKPSQCSLIA